MTTTTVDAWSEARTAHQIADELEFELSLVVQDAQVMILFPGYLFDR
jgi:hypothetical protein